MFMDPGLCLDSLGLVHELEMMEAKRVSPVGEVNDA
jgi:hypothetical protein